VWGRKEGFDVEADHVRDVTHGRHGERNIGNDGERTVKLLVEAHEPQSVEGLYIREAPAVEAARSTPEAPRSQGRT